MAELKTLSAQPLMSCKVEPFRGGNNDKFMIFHGELSVVYNVLSPMSPSRNKAEIVI